MTTEATIQALNTALATFKTEYLEQVKEVAIKTYQKMTDELTANGWDKEKVAPYPKAWSMSKMDYRAAVSKHERISRFFKSVKSCRNTNEPNIVKEIPGARDLLIEEYQQDALASFDSYVQKLAAKIGKEVLTASIFGSMWKYSILTVTTPEGMEKWKTQCIINRSSLGRLFNQWPTRKYSV